MDSKLQEVLLDYGLEGYGLYFYCLELIAANVESHNLTFELEHDARIIARNTGSTVQRVQEMMTRFIALGLFENNNGVITCLKMLTRTDEYTQKIIRKEFNKQNNTLPSVPTSSGHDPDNIPPNRIEEKEEKDKNNPPAAKFDFTDSFDEFWNLWPKRGDSKKPASEKFKSKAKNQDQANEILEGLRKHLPVLTKTDNQFIPKASTWLNQERWNDDVIDSVAPEDKPWN